MTGNRKLRGTTNKASSRQRKIDFCLVRVKGIAMRIVKRAFLLDIDGRSREENITEKVVVSW